MNQRNVAALVHLIAEWQERHRRMDPSATRDFSLAEWLASRGALVPESMTDAETRQFLLHPKTRPEFSTLTPANRIRAELERIAKGEP